MKYVRMRSITPATVLAAVMLAAFGVAGCSKGDTTGSNVSAAVNPSADPSKQADTSNSSQHQTTQNASTAGESMTNHDEVAHDPAISTGDAGHGATIFKANCASCHGQNGAGGGIGPVLKNEKSRKSYRGTVAWIKAPQPPMPRLYPAPLSQKDVNDVAAYVQSL